MSSLVHGGIRHYAVISIRADRCERLVIQYLNEASLRKLIAPSTILRSGYRSREEAQASIDRSTTAFSMPERLTAALITIARALERLALSERKPPPFT